MVQIRTEFWKCSDNEQWKQRYAQIAWIVAFFGAINTITGLALGSLTVTLGNLVPIIFAGLVIHSKNKYYKNKEKTP